MSAAKKESREEANGEVARRFLVLEKRGQRKRTRGLKHLGVSYGRDSKTTIQASETTNDPNDLDLLKIILVSLASNWDLQGKRSS